MSAPRSDSLSRNNHYVSQATLRRWATDGTTVFARRLLVSHPSVPEWQRRPVRGLAYQEDLYTSSASGQETDAIERWFASDFEEPVSRSIDRVAKGDRLSRDDWHNLARHFALQDLRTPTRFFEQMERWGRELPSLLQETLKDSVVELKRISQRETEVEDLPAARPEAGRRPQREPFAGLLDISVKRPADSSLGPAVIHVETTLGRKWWLESIDHLLKDGAADRLLDNKWSIAQPADDGEWPLTDHPALKMHWMGPTDYHFEGGWGRRNADLALPLTPRHLLFSQVGADLGRKITLNQAQTERMRQLLIERASRWVFATQPLEWVQRFRPRVVDSAKYAEESAMWASWSEQQLRADPN